MSDYWLMINEEKIGPLDESGIRDLIKQKLVGFDTECRCGDGPWKRVGDFREIVVIPAAYQEQIPTFQFSPVPKLIKVKPPKEPEPPFHEEPLPTKERKAFSIQHQLDSERTWRWAFNFSPIKLMNLVLAVVGWTFIVSPLVVGILLFLIGIPFVFQNGWLAFWKFVSGMPLLILVISIPMFAIGTLFLAAVELTSRFCLIEEHLRAIREGKSSE